MICTRRYQQENVRITDGVQMRTATATTVHILGIASVADASSDAISVRRMQPSDVARAGTLTSTTRGAALPPVASGASAKDIKPLDDAALAAGTTGCSMAALLYGAAWLFAPHWCGTGLAVGAAIGALVGIDQLEHSEKAKAEREALASTPHLANSAGGDVPVVRPSR